MQSRSALLIRLLLHSMLPAVEFNDQSSAQTTEVNNKGAKSMLAAELYSDALSIA